MSFFRYPGGKTKLKKQILAKLNHLSDGKNLEYREPFFGGGSIGLKLLQNNADLDRIWINDLDPGVASLWTSLIKYPNELKGMIENFKPDVGKFDEFKEELTKKTPSLNEVNEIVEFGFKKLAIHQISYSGLGTKSGGPLGGRSQKSNYKIDCRWSPKYICNKIDSLNSSFNKLSVRTGHCTRLDFSELINDTEHDSLIYLDPPYYVKGGDLYQCSFMEEDHIRLSNCLKDTKHKWLLSYDDCKEVRNLYKWAKIEEISDVNYSITALKVKNEDGKAERRSRRKVELLISTE
jgi:DNA adenine methylase